MRLPENFTGIVAPIKDFFSICANLRPSVDNIFSTGGFHRRNTGTLDHLGGMVAGGGRNLDSAQHARDFIDSLPVVKPGNGCVGAGLVRFGHLQMMVRLRRHLR
jgi:hypothetical protein